MKCFVFYCARKCIGCACIYDFIYHIYLFLMLHTKKKQPSYTDRVQCMLTFYLIKWMPLLQKIRATWNKQDTYTCVFIYYAMIKFSNRNGKEIQKPIHIYLHIRRSRTHYIHMCAKFVHCNCNYFPANGRIAAEREIPCNNKREPILFFMSNVE